MPDEMKLHRQRTAGHKAQSLWDSPILQGFFAELDEEIRRGWKDSKADEADRREEIYHFMRAVEDLKHRFQKCIGTGRFAEKELHEIEESKGR